MSDSSNFASGLDQNTLLAKPMSRRLFLSASAVVGVLTFKGSVLGGTLQAWADESGQQHFVIYILSKTEVPIMVYDVSGASPVPVAGCSVTVGSWCTETSKTVVTDESGFAPMDVKELSFQRDDDAASVYDFWGSVSAEKDGYRQFYEGLSWIEAGTATAPDGSRPNTIEVPTQPDDGTPYLRALMMDDWDIQYVSDLSAYTRESNTADQVVKLQVASGRAGAQVAASVLVNGEEVRQATATASAEAPYVAELSFADKWLALLKPGDELSVRFGIQGGTTYSFTCPLAFEETTLLSEDGQIENLPISPGLSSDQTPETREPVVMPDWMGRKGDGAFLNLPFIPIQFFFDEAGRFGVAATLVQVNFLKKHNGEDLLAGKDRVKSFKGLTGKQAWENYKQDVSYWIDNWKEAYGKGKDSEPGSSVQAFGTSKLTRDINARFALSAMGYGNVKKGVKTGTLYTTLDAGLCADLFVGFAFTQQLVICYVPVYWTFDVSANLKMKLLLGMAFEDCFENVDWSHHAPGNADIGCPAFVVAFHLEVGLAVGVGIAGVCSVAIRGYGYFHMDFTFDQVEGKPYPQMRFYLGGGVQVIAQCFFFKAVATPVYPADWVLYDNTTTASASLTGQLEGVGQAPDFFTLPEEDMQLVTDADLAAHMEAKGTWNAAGEAGLASPRFGLADRLMKSEAFERLRKAKAGAVNLFHAKQSESAYNPINGLKPTIEELLWEGCYSNPRLRIVHTSEDSFTDDRCFMIRIAAVNVEVPASVNAFKSGAFWRAKAEEVGEAATEMPAATPAAGNQGEAVGEGVEAAGAAAVATTATATGAAAATDAVATAAATGALRANIYRAEGANELTVVGDGLGNCKVVPTIDVETETAAGMRRVERGASETTTVSRLRLLVSEWNEADKVWGAAEVVDFIAEGEVYESDRLNAHDIDFDVEALSDGTLLLAITSLTRPDGAESHTLLEYEKRQYISLVRWDHTKKTAVAAGSTRSINTIGKSLFHPRIVRQFFDDGLGNPGQRCLVYSYVCEYDANGRTDCKFAVTAFDDMDGEGTGATGQHRLTPPVDVFPDNLSTKPNPNVLATGTFEVACPDRELYVEDASLGLKRSVAVISWSRAKSSDMEALSFVLSETFAMKRRSEGSTVQYEPSVELHSYLPLSKVPGIAKLTSHDQKGLFSYADTAYPGDVKPLRLVLFDKSNFTLTTAEDTGDTDKARYFSSFNGRRLYTVRVMDGENPGLSGVAAEAVANGAAYHSVSGPYNSPQASDATSVQEGSKRKVTLYQLLEARWVDELQAYYDFYPIAQLDHVPDNIGVIAADDVRTDFTFANVVTESKGASESGDGADTAADGAADGAGVDASTDLKANLYQVAVPKIMAATCDNASPVSPFAAAGDTCWYTIDVTNVGNAPITLIAMTAYASDGTAFATDTFSDLSLYVQGSPESVRGVYGANGQLQLDESGCGKYTLSEDARDTAGILWPGTTRTYKFGFTVPEGAGEGDVEFSVGIAAVEDHMDDEVVSQRLQSARESLAAQADQADQADQAGQAVPLILPFARSAQGGAQELQTGQGAQGGQAGEGVDSRLEEVIYGGGSMFCALRHKMRVAIMDRESKIGFGSRAAANYAVVGPDGKPVGPDDGSGTGAGGKAPAATGDAAAPAAKVSAAGLLLGAAAAGVAAYEKRRAENEGR